MTEELAVGNQFSQEDVRPFHPDVFVNPHPRTFQILSRLQLMGIHLDHVVQDDLTVHHGVGTLADAKSLIAHIQNSCQSADSSVGQKADIRLRPSPQPWPRFSFRENGRRP